MQDPGRRPFAGVDLRRPKGYPPVASTATEAALAEEEAGGDPCPRCESRDTKFCYYNNYNTSQPRHYCRSCRRYWTKGGSLRNVPVGGGSRKSASSCSSSSSSSASPKRAKNSKRRRVVPSEPEPGTTDAAGAAEKEAIGGGTIGYPTTDVDAARDTANGTVEDPATAVPAARTDATAVGAMDDAVCDPATAVDAARTEATANGTVCYPATTVDAALTEATANGTVDDPATAVDAARKEATADGDAGAPPAVDDGGYADSSVALGLGVAEKEPCDTSPFEWPSGCDLGSYWAPGDVFADTDPVLFLDLP